MPARLRRGLGRGEPVKVLMLGPGGLPKQFTFRGRRYLVRSVAARPEAGELRSGPGGSAQWMEVRTESGLRAILSWQRSGDRWRMERILQ